MTKPKLTDDDFCRASKRLGCEVSAIKAVAEVESKGEGFYPDGFPVILFERHKFHRFTNGRFDKDYPKISNPVAGGYGPAGANQRQKFNLAFSLDPIAAMKSCSWGKFQIMGFNYEVCGFQSVGAFVDAMKLSEGRQLDAFVAFILSTGLGDELRRKDWKGLAAGYNGPDYEENKYDTRLAAADKKYSKENIDCSKTSAAAPSVNSQSGDPAAAAEKLTKDESDPTSTEQPSITNTVEQKTTLTKTDGETTQQQQTTVTADKNVAVEKEEQIGFFQKIKLKLAGWFAALGGLAGLDQYKQQIDALGLPGWMVAYAMVGLIAAMFIWFLYEAVRHLMEWWLKRKRTEKIAELNSTPTNTVTIVSPDELDKYQKMGWIVIRRN